MDTIDLNPFTESTDRWMINCVSSGWGLSHPMITIPFLSFTVKKGRLSCAFAEDIEIRIDTKQMNTFPFFGLYIDYKGNLPGLKNEFIVAKRPVSLKASAMN
jgi:hypothetical protein